MKNSYIDRAKKLYETLDEETINRLNEEGRKKADDSYHRFVNAYNEGQCYLCGGPLKTFSVKKPCLHWLLRPKGLKKKHYKEFWNHFGYFRMEAYCRWLANQHEPFKAINDLHLERNSEKIIETTIRYKHLEWSFSCSQSDFDGHASSHNGSFPHFHFQMRIDKKPFINYSENHVPFSDEDLWKFEMINQDDIPFEHNFRYGEGMQSVFNDNNTEMLLEQMELSEDESDAAFKIDTFVSAKPGETISGDDIADLIEESKRTKIPLSKLMRQLDVTVNTVVSPGRGVPEIASRSTTKRNK